MTQLLIPQEVLTAYLRRRAIHSIVETKALWLTHRTRLATGIAYGAVTNARAREEAKCAVLNANGIHGRCRGFDLGYSGEGVRYNIFSIRFILPVLRFPKLAR